MLAVYLIGEASAKQTKRVIHEALARLLRGMTVLVIAHCLSIIVNADMILVIHDGRIIERGEHAELLSLGGANFHLYSSGFED